jgi:hypothetical protein
MSYTEPTRMRLHEGTVDEAIEHYVLHGGTQTDAANGRCDAGQLSRAIKALKEANAWDDHVADIISRRGAEKPEGSREKRELEMPTPRSLGKMIKSAPDRLGDGRPYGSKGNTWKEYREGHKLATSAVAEAGVSIPHAKRASARLAEAGIHIGKTVLYEGAKNAPGKTPVRMGNQSLKLPDSFIEAGRKVVIEMRDLNQPNLKCMVKAELNSMIRGTRFEALFENGEITDRAYYTFLDRSDLYSHDTRPLEDDRALWRHSQNAVRQYTVWAETFVDAKLAVYAPKFVDSPDSYFTSAEPYDELILWYPGAENHVGSSDETDVAADETARCKSPEQRSVLVAAPGSRRGHRAAGRGGGGAGSSAGWVKSVKERREEPSRDSGEIPATKGGCKFTYVAADLMSGASCQTLIVSKHSTESLAKKVDLPAVSPVSALVDTRTGTRLAARFTQTDSGGVELSTMTTILNDIFLPAFGRGDDELRLSRAPTVEDPDDVVCWDGLKQHLSLQWLRASREKRVRTCIRYSHGSQDNQHEDFQNFSRFKPAFAAEKMKLRTDTVIAAKAAATAAGHPISAQARIAAGKLTEGDILRCAKTPWEEAFSKETTLAGWQKEGIFPKFNCALFWRLKAEEAMKDTDVARPAAVPDEEWVRKFNGPHSSAASICADPKLLNEEEMNAEVARRVAARLAGAPAPEKLPPVTAGNVSKLKGSASGEQAVWAVREKEIERLVEEKLKEHRKDEKDTKKDEKMDTSFAKATEGLELYSTSGLDALKNDHLKGILSAHGITPKGIKSDFQEQLGTLLREKMAKGASEQAVLAEMKRTTAAAAAARQVNDRPLASPLALPAPQQAAEAAPMLLHEPQA